MTDRQHKISLRFGNGADELDALEPLWNALQEHHAAVLPTLGPGTRPRPLTDAWDRRRSKYERWLEDPESFFVLATRNGVSAGYAFVTVGSGYAGWKTGRLGTLETLAVLPEHRGATLGTRLLDAAWSRLGEKEIDEMAITTAITNLDSHRFYERHGFTKAFVLYYGKRPRD
jgi:ribosomal protein S18 acetylase RimI-like enzyme